MTETSAHKPNALARAREHSHRVSGSSGVAVGLNHYAPGERHHRHEHDHVQVSFLLTGTVEERIGRRTFEVTTPAVCIKPTGADHDDLWGKSGALMLTVRLSRDDMLEQVRTEQGKWRSCAAPALSLVKCAMTATDAEDVDALAADLLGSLDGRDPGRSQPPPWLRHVTEALWDGEMLTSVQAAKIAGVHRVHLSRAFAQHVGMPFSQYRRRIAASRAVERIVHSDERLAEVAIDAGFADQAHMTRSLDEITGAPPSLLRRLLRDSCQMRS